MSKNSKIQWTDHSWPIVTGCIPKSAGCANCYAIKDSWRLSHNPNPKIREIYTGTVEKKAETLRWTGLIKYHPDRLKWVEQWKKPARIFVSNMADLFSDDVPEWFLDLTWAYMAVYKRHTYQVLTKCPDRLNAYLNDANTICRIAMWINVGLDQNKHPGNDYPLLPLNNWAYDEFSWPLTNVWVGVSVENQSVTHRINTLLETPATIRFISCEPLLGPVELRPHYLYDDYEESYRDNEKLDWIIVGGESGPNARVCQVKWIQSIVNQCEQTGTPIFVKQLGSRSNLEVKGKGDNLEEWPQSLRVQEFPSMFSYLI